MFGRHTALLERVRAWPRYARHWHVDASERAATYPCMRYAVRPYDCYLRGIDVEADAETTFRWLCQLKVAPYSYDWLDNLGRRSPRTLTPGAERLTVGQRFLIGRIVEFVPGRHITALSTRRASRLFGPIALTYQVAANGPSQSRLVVCMTVTARSWPGRLRRELLGWGDLVMMRRQLRTLKRLAEASVTMRDDQSPTSPWRAPSVTE
jgi:hypothetical protein